MFKLTISMAIMLLLLIAISWYSIHIFNQQASQLNNILFNIKDDLTEDNWEKAQNKLDILDDIWSKTERTWSPFMDHAEIETLDLTIIRIKSSIYEKDRTQSLTEIAVAQRLLYNIPKKEYPLIKNIF